MAKGSILDRLGLHGRKSAGSLCGTNQTYRTTSSVSSSADQAYLEVRKGTISNEELEIQRLQYQLLETHREIALIEDTNIDLSGGNESMFILSQVQKVNSATGAEGVTTDLENQVRSLHRQLAQNIAILKQKDEEISVIEKRIESIKVESISSYEQATHQVRQYTTKNNDLALALSRCQIDLIDLRKLNKEIFAQIVLIQHQITILMEEHNRQHTPEPVPDSDDTEDDDEFDELVIIRRKLLVQISEYKEKHTKSIEDDKTAAYFQEQLTAAIKQITMINDQNAVMKEQNASIQLILDGLRGNSQHQDLTSLKIDIDLKATITQEKSLLKRERERLLKLIEWRTERNRQISYDSKTLL